METERDGVSAKWLSYFLKDLPESATIRGYEEEIQGMIVEMPAPRPKYEGEVVTLAIVHNDCRVGILDDGKRLGLTEKNEFLI